MSNTKKQAQQTIEQLVDRYHQLELDKAAHAETTEANVVHQFITPLLKALNWPIDDPHRFKYELSLDAGRPDMVLFPEQSGAIFVEAKRFGKIAELPQVRKKTSGFVAPTELTLPGMATDRSKEEQQAINYAFESGGTWAILTNFEKLRLFNARRDWLVLSFERPSALLDEFELLWQLAYENINMGGLDHLSNQRHRADVDSDYLNFINLWRQRLARDILEQPEQNPWAITPEGRVNLTALRAVVQRILDRLVLVRFAEDHLIAGPGTLYSMLEFRLHNMYAAPLTELFAQLYRRFDEVHNSALFAPHLADEAVFSEHALRDLINKLYEARYRAMSADIMGNTYEQYLGQTLVLVNGIVATRDNLETRKKQGSYYTPQVIVRYLVDHSLGRYLYGTTTGQPDGPPLSEHVAPKTAADIRELRVLDPASGSGSFLIYAYQVLADFYRAEIRRLEEEINQVTEELIQAGKSPLDIRIELSPLQYARDTLKNYPRRILENHLYGVDLDPQAAEIATVNLMMRAMADQGGAKKRLPLILNQNIKVGNALIGRVTLPAEAHDAADLAELRRLRRQLLSEEQSSEHEQTLQAIAEIADRLKESLNEPLLNWFADPTMPRPFHWAVEYPEAFVDEHGQPLENPGFQVIIGNPPWEIVKPDYREYYAQFDPDIESKLTRRQVEARVKQLDAEDPRREIEWAAQKARIEAHATYYNNSADFTQQGRGDTATHKLFLERAYDLLTRHGHLGFVIPSGIYTDKGTTELREMLFKESRVDYLYGLANVRGFFPDVDSRFKFTLLGAQKGGQTDRFRAMFLISHAEWPRITDAKDASTILSEVLNDESRIFEMHGKMIERFSPDTFSVMEFKSKQDYEIAEKIYGNWPNLGDEVSDWNIKFWREFDMTNARHLFNQVGQGVPLYEGKMIHQFDAYFAKPRYWVLEKDLKYRHSRLGVRAIARNTDIRTLISTMLPPLTGAGNSILTVAENLDSKKALFALAVFNSFVLDFILRLKVASNVNMFILYQLPLPRLTAGNPYFEAIVPRAARLTCTTAAFAELWQTVMDAPWTEASPTTDPAERVALRHDLDALVAHLYGLTRDEFAHVLSTFPLVFPPTAEGDHAQQTLLNRFDHWAETVRDWPRM